MSPLHTRSIVLGSLFTVACHSHARRDPEAVPIVAPEAWSAAGETVGDHLPEQWWRDLDDPTLIGLIDQLVADNLGLKQAWSRLAQAKAAALGAGAGQLPSVEASATSTRARGYDPFGNAATANRHAVSVGASYEVDLWGRIDDLVDAAKFEVQASRLDVEALAITMTARVAETWYDLVEQRAQRALIRAQLATNETLLELVEARFAQGLVSAVDVFQQRQNVIATRSRLPPVEARVEVLEHQLATLVGRVPSERVDGDRGELPVLPTLPAVGVPSDLLQRRPDVKAAGLRVQSTDARVGAAIADRYPSIRLSASTGFGATSFADLVDRWVWSITGSVVAPLFDGNRRKAEVDRQRAVLEAALHGYAAVLLTAMAEVEDALAQERRQHELVALLEGQLDVSNRLLTEARVRYSRGLSDFLPVLGAVQGLQRVESSLLSAQRRLISNRIQLYRALGGTWTEALKAPQRSAGT